MPDGAHLLPHPRALPPSLVDAAVRAFGVSPEHPWIMAAVSWVQFQRDGEGDRRAIAEHYALWCFDRAYYDGFNRFVMALRMGDR